MWGILIAILSGALMSLQGIFNSSVTKQTSIWLAAAFVQLSAFCVCAIAYITKEREVPVSKLFAVSPKYLLIGGILGAFITITVIKGIDLLGAAKAEMFIVFSQLIVAYVIELFGWFGVQQKSFEWNKFFGVALFLAGVILFKIK